MTKQEFDAKYVGENIDVHCDTEEKAIAFLKMAEEFGYKWSTGREYWKYNHWNVYKERTYYHLLVGMYGDVTHKYSYRRVVPFNLSAPTPKSLIEHLDTVTCANRCEAIIIVKNGVNMLWMGSLYLNEDCFGNYNDNLDYLPNKASNIVKITDKNGNVKWTRPEEISPQQLEIESIRVEMQRLTDRLGELKAGELDV